MKLPTLIQKLVPTLYEDDHLLAVAKPAGINAAALPGAAGTGLAEILADLRGRGETFEPANRLAKYESGVLLLAKDPAIMRHIRTGLNSARVPQDYAAVVLGSIGQSKLFIEPTHGTSRGKKPRKQDSKRSRSAKGSSLARESQQDRRPTAGSRRTVLTTLRSGKKRTLVLCRTTVENTHALRAQLRAKRLRLLGDNVHDRTAHRRTAHCTCLHLGKISFHHPIKESKITISCRHGADFEAYANGEQPVQRQLLAALARRLSCVAKENIDSFRLISGNAEDVPGFVAEKFGPVVLLQVTNESPGLVAQLPAVARWYKETLGVQAVYLKPAQQTSPDTSDESARRALQSPRLLVGRSVPREFEINENGLRFLVKPFDGPSVGLFLDQRENRGRVRAVAAGKDVLNLFAYTGGFSVAAAAGGANTTVSVDLSGKHLDWARANFALNKIEITHHRFIKSDAADYLKRATRQEKKFDMILIDPPSFAHGRKRSRSFSILTDLPAMIGRAAGLLRPGGTMMISTNYRRLPIARFCELAKKGMGKHRCRITDTPRLPVDFAPDPPHAKTIFLRLE